MSKQPPTKSIPGNVLSAPVGCARCHDLWRELAEAKRRIVELESALRETEKFLKEANQCQEPSA